MKTMSLLANRGVIAVAIFSLLICLTGCSHEKWVRTGIIYDQVDPAAPDWVKGKMPVSETELFFVGRGVGYNILDERGAYNAARDHVLQQLAAQIGTLVEIHAVEVDRRLGRQMQPPVGQRVNAGHSFPWSRDSTMRMRVANEAVVAASVLAGDLEERGIYWEEWKVTDRPSRGTCHRRMQHYKCWVLMAIPREKFKERVRVTANILMRQAEYNLTKMKMEADLERLAAVRMAKLHVIRDIYDEELARIRTAHPNTLYDVYDQHDHETSSRRNFNLQDVRNVLDAASIKIARGEDFTAADAKDVLDGAWKAFEVYMRIFEDDAYAPAFRYGMYAGRLRPPMRRSFPPPSSR